MPDKRQHRGAHPDDEHVFNDSTAGILKLAVEDMSWLLSRGYAQPSSIKLVGDRYNLSARQRMAIQRCACSDENRAHRHNRNSTPETIRGQDVLIDGYNLLITAESALAEAVLLVGRDGCIRDLASIHGTYRKVEETLPAIEMIGNVLFQLCPNQVIWLLDRPVSNSGRLKKIIETYASQHNLNWTIKLVQNPDTVLIQSNTIIATSDSVVLDGCSQWLNLARLVVMEIGKDRPLNLIDLSDRSSIINSDI